MRDSIQDAGSDESRSEDQDRLIHKIEEFDSDSLGSGQEDGDELDHHLANTTTPRSRAYRLPRS